MCVCVCACQIFVCVCLGACVFLCPCTCMFVSALAAMGRGALGGAAAPGQEQCGSLHREEALADTRDETGREREGNITSIRTEKTSRHFFFF